MRAFLIALLVATALPAALAGCSSAPQSQAPASVEDRKPGAEGAKPVDSTSVKAGRRHGGPPAPGWRRSRTRRYPSKRSI